MNTHILSIGLGMVGPLGLLTLLILAGIGSCDLSMGLPHGKSTLGTCAIYASNRSLLLPVFSVLLWLEAMGLFKRYGHLFIYLLPSKPGHGRYATAISQRA